MKRNSATRYCIWSYHWKAIATYKFFRNVLSAHASEKLLVNKLERYRGIRTDIYIGRKYFVSFFTSFNQAGSMPTSLQHDNRKRYVLEWIGVYYLCVFTYSSFGKFLFCFLFLFDNWVVCFTVNSHQETGDVSFFGEHDMKLHLHKKRGICEDMTCILYHDVPLI